MWTMVWSGTGLRNSQSIEGVKQIRKTAFCIANQDLAQWDSQSYWKKVTRGAAVRRQCQWTSVYFFDQSKVI